MKSGCTQRFQVTTVQIEIRQLNCTANLVGDKVVTQLALTLSGQIHTRHQFSLRSLPSPSPSVNKMLPHGCCIGESHHTTFDFWRSPQGYIQLPYDTTRAPRLLAAARRLRGCPNTNPVADSCTDRVGHTGMTSGVVPLYVSLIEGTPGSAVDHNSSSHRMSPVL